MCDWLATSHTSTRSSRTNARGNTPGSGGGKGREGGGQGGQRATGCVGGAGTCPQGVARYTGRPGQGGPTRSCEVHRQARPGEPHKEFVQCVKSQK